MNRIKGVVKLFATWAGYDPSAMAATARALASPLSWPRSLRYGADRSKFRRAARENNLVLPPFVSYPCLYDRQLTTPIADLHYFYQNVWAAAQISRVCPGHVIDIGSASSLVAAVAQFVPVTAVDIRPLAVKVPNLECREGSILDLPFESNALEFVMSLCVVEHIGLGRYGDPIDPLGTDKACKELIRVTRPGGRLLLSVPVGPSCIAFNAHRIFAREEFLSRFPDLEIEQEIFCDPEFKTQDPTASKQLGCFSIYCALLRKRNA